MNISDFRQDQDTYQQATNIYLHPLHQPIHNLLPNNNPNNISITHIQNSHHPIQQPQGQSQAMLNYPSDLDMNHNLFASSNFSYPASFNFAPFPIQFSNDQSQKSRNFDTSFQISTNGLNYDIPFTTTTTTDETSNFVSVPLSNSNTNSSEYTVQIAQPAAPSSLSSPAVVNQFHNNSISNIFEFPDSLPSSSSTFANSTDNYTLLSQIQVNTDLDNLKKPNNNIDNNNNVPLTNNDDGSNNNDNIFFTSNQSGMNSRSISLSVHESAWRSNSNSQITSNMSLHNRNHINNNNNGDNNEDVILTPPSSATHFGSFMDTPDTGIGPLGSRGSPFNIDLSSLDYSAFPTAHSLNENASHEIIAPKENLLNTPDEDNLDNKGQLPAKQKSSLHASKPIRKFKTKSYVDKATKSQKSNKKKDSTGESSTSLVNELISRDVAFQMLLKNKENKTKSEYDCSHCERKFEDVEEYIIHLDKYKLIRSHKCPIKDCPYNINGLSRHSEVVRHCASQHSETFENIVKRQMMGDIGVNKNYKDTSKVMCTRDGCGKKFKRKDSLQRHLKLVHDNKHSRFNQKSLMRKSLGIV